MAGQKPKGTGINRKTQGRVMLKQLHILGEKPKKKQVGCICWTKREPEEYIAGIEVETRRRKRDKPQTRRNNDEKAYAAV